MYVLHGMKKKIASLSQQKIYNGRFIDAFEVSHVLYDEERTNPSFSHMKVTAV